MAHQYFQVGEDVGLVSQDHSEVNGNYKVKNILIPDYLGYVICPYVGKETITSSPCLYELEGLVVKCKITGYDVHWAAQASLRKIDKGSTSWETMMEGLEELMEEEL